MSGIFREGQLSGRSCPKCDEPLVFEMSFSDCFSHAAGHYTVDCPIETCTRCGHVEDYEGGDGYED